MDYQEILTSRLTHLSNPGTALFLSFLAGVLSSLTPCVYPLIPVTVAIFSKKTGEKESESKAQVIFASLVYVLGVVLMFTSLGVIAAKSGMIFGSFLSNPFIAVLLGIFVILLALYTLDIVPLPFLAKLQGLGTLNKAKGIVGIFLMGLLSGIVAAPCIGPLLIVILGIVSKSSNLIFGASLLAAYGVGFSLLFFLVGVLSGFARSLPRPGKWLYGVKFIIAVSLFVVALFLLQPVLKNLFTSFSLIRNIIFLSILTFLAGVSALIGFRKTNSFLKILAALVLAIVFNSSVLNLWGPLYAYSKKDTSTVHLTKGLFWYAKIESAVAAAKERNSIIMVDLYADWCAACKEYELKTFADPRVKAKLKEIVLARIDFTEMNEVTDKIVKKFKVKGLPTILFLTPKGKEIPDTRLEGFVNADGFLAHLKKVEQSFNKQRKV
ncbi:MAG: DUF255 domain-containing protein [Candidatus Dadabacteria bacterium]|nr:MAG: DUF255 domain-containing protein [Candidatus Dadabacteria bacterium]